VSDETIKVTFQIQPMAKERLKTLKIKLLEQGYRESESSLIERLLSPWFIRALETDVKEGSCELGPPVA
jgi:hypothetical protein